MLESLVIIICEALFGFVFCLIKTALIFLSFTFFKQIPLSNFTGIDHLNSLNSDTQMLLITNSVLPMTISFIHQGNGSRNRTYL